MRFDRITELAHHFLSLTVKAGDRVVDATAGNGHDTLYLAGIVGPGGHVYAFDIQPEALRRTREKLNDRNLLDRVTLINAGHERLQQYVTEPVAAVIYNLGYLSGGDRSKTTKHTTTLESLDQALQLIKPGGIVVVVLYPGHAEGRIEKKYLLERSRNLNSRQYSVLHLQIGNSDQKPPEILLFQSNLFGITGTA